MANRFTRLLGAAIILACAATADAAQPDSTTVSYRPNIHGTFRGRFEATLSGDRAERFQARNARVSIDGMAATWVNYYFQADVCDRGTMKILDVWARLTPVEGFSLQAGQFRMPFGVESFRSPHTYIFANRSFVGKQMANYRAVGVKASWQPKGTALQIEAGAFNPTTISDHTGWHHSLAYAAKAAWRTGNVALSAGFLTTSPDSARFNIADVSVRWAMGRWEAEAEYMHKRYAHSRHQPAHSYIIWGNYKIPLRGRLVNQISLQGRFDGITAHSSGRRDRNTGLLTTDQPPCNRLTLGVTLSHLVSKNLFVDLRANYENYFYRNATAKHAVGPDGSDKALVELVVRF